MSKGYNRCSSSALCKQAHAVQNGAEARPRARHGCAVLCPTEILNPMGKLWHMTRRRGGGPAMGAWSLGCTLYPKGKLWQVALRRGGGPAMDAWSLGCVLAELALQRPMFPADSPAQLLQQALPISSVPASSVQAGRAPTSADQPTRCHAGLPKTAAHRGMWAAGAAHLRVLGWRAAAPEYGC